MKPRAAPPVFPLPGHRTQGEVMADEAILRRARERFLQKERDRQQIYRERKANACLALAGAA